MKLSLLIADPCDILRAGLRTIFAHDKRIAMLYEASNAEELQKHLQSGLIDLVIANQIIVPDITILPSHHFVLIASEFNIATFLTASKHGAKGYLLEASQAELFRTLPGLPAGAFLIEPSLTINIVENLTKNTRFLFKEELLTPREKEIVCLLREGVDRHTIAQKLSISATTLKTHIKNISRKRIDPAI